MNVLRIAKIKWVLARYGIDNLIYSVPGMHAFRFLSYLNPFNWFRSKSLSRGERIRLALEKLGPIFVKFGQILSTRCDMLPDDIIEELSKLRDRVPPFSSNKAIAIIESTYGKPVEEMFRSFESEPLASASIAQVHSAELPDGQSIVIKILRPHIEKDIKRDLKLLKLGAKLLECFAKKSRRLKPVAMVEEIEQCFLHEIDLMQEASNATQLKHNLERDHGIYIPNIYWDYCHHNIMVMEKIHGTPVADLEALKAQGVDLKKLAANGLEVFFTQIFRDRYFHGDLHPGNIFINPEHSSFILVDFGIMGSLDASDQRYIAENLLAFLKRDYYKVAKLHVECGWVPKTARVDQFETAIRTVCEPIFNRPLKEISYGTIVMKLIQTARQFEMNIQPQLLVLQKTLLQIEGLCRQLDPDLNMWTTVKPIIEKWLKKQVGPKAFLKKVKEQIPYWLERAPEIPELIHEALKEKEQYAAQPKKASHRWLNFSMAILLLILLVELNTGWLPMWSINTLLAIAIAGFIFHFIMD